MSIESKSLTTLLAYAVSNGASDIHFRVGETPVFRIRGDLATVKMPPLTPEDIATICDIVTTGYFNRGRLEDIRELDGSFELPGVSRFRFNIFRHGSRLSVILRLVPFKVPGLEELGLPEANRRIATSERGLILVAGATNAGKSTTLAAMIDFLNSTEALHIVTIEDPVEFVYPQRKARITQREVGRDTESFATALRAVLRQDPDVILIGEMRDAESVDIALKAAETGHAVFSTIHTTDVAKTVSRLVSMFPPEEQGMVRLRLAESLRAVISQRLLKRADGSGRIAAQEIMISNAAIQECIVDPRRTHEILQFIENGFGLTGAQTFDQHLLQLYKGGVITRETARQASVNPSDFERNLMFEKNHTDSQKIAEAHGTIGEDCKLVLETRSESPRVDEEQQPQDDGEGKTGFLKRAIEIVKKAA